MSLNFLLDYLVHSSVLKKCRKLFKEFCGFDLELLDCHGERVRISALQENRLPAVVSLNRSRWFSVDTETEGNELWPIIKELISDSKARVVMTSTRCRSILVPIHIKEKAVGLLHVAESSPRLLTENKIGCLTSFLEEIVVPALDNEFKIMDRLEADNTLSFQQKLVSRAKNFIENNYHNHRLTLADVASHNCVSYCYLSRLFKKELRMSFTDYLCQLRLKVAANLLKNRSINISQVAYNCGFEDPSYFCKVFKRRHGTTPAGYRKKLNPLFSIIPKPNAIYPSHSRTVQVSQ